MNEKDASLVRFRHSVYRKVQKISSHTGRQWKVTHQKSTKQATLCSHLTLPCDIYFFADINPQTYNGFGQHRHTPRRQQYPLCVCTKAYKREWDLTINQQTNELTAGCRLILLDHKPPRIKFVEIEVLNVIHITRMRSLIDFIVIKQLTMSARSEKPIYLISHS